jgi:hypothetical protein
MINFVTSFTTIKKWRQILEPGVVVHAEAEAGGIKSSRPACIHEIGSLIFKKTNWELREWFKWYSACLIYMKL